MALRRPWRRSTGRGGIDGRCLDLKVCDGKADGPTELSCARAQTEDKSMVAGLASTFFVSEADAYQLFENADLPQIGAQVTRPGAWNSPVSFEFTMGGAGTRKRTRSWDSSSASSR